MQYKYTDIKLHIDWSPEMIYWYLARTDSLPLLPTWFDFFFIISFEVFRNALGFVDKRSGALSWDPPIRKKRHYLQNSHLKLNNSTYVEKPHHETISNLLENRHKKNYYSCLLHRLTIWKMVIKTAIDQSYGKDCNL